MNIEFLKNDETVTFRVTNFSAAIEQALKMCFYEQVDEAYLKRFPASTAYLDKIMAHYQKHAEEMFLQLVYQQPIPWEKGLLAFLTRVGNTQVDWWLTGSCAACIRGIPLRPHDIDIMVDSQSVALITELFSEHIIEPIVDTNGWLTKDFGVLFMHCRVDIASDPQERLDEPEPVDCGPFAKSVLEVVEWHGYKIRVPPIALHLNVNKRRQRTDRVKLIEQYMSTHQN